LKQIPQGNDYADILSNYFIASPTMMIRKSVLDELNGYDETLSYEDFDFWVRASRNHKFAFLNEVTTKIRRNISSMSSGWYRKGDTQLRSTYLVCKKALQLNRTKKEQDALVKRLRFEIRQSVFSENHEEAKLFYRLLTEMRRSNFVYSSLMMLNSMKLPLAWIRNAYHKIRYS
jgi:hypothetical protein